MANDVRTLSVRAPDRAGSTNPLAELIQNRASRWGDAAYLVPAGGGRARSFRELDAATRKWSAYLDAGPCSAGEAVGLCIADPVEFGLAFLAIMASGRWVAPLDPDLPRQGSAGLAASATRLGLAVVLADRRAPERWPLDWVDVHDVPGVTPSGTDAGGPTRRRGSGAGGVLLASSGTTGTPKMMALTVRQLLYTARLIAGHHRLSPSDRGFNPLPLFHVNGEVVGLLAPLVAGGSMVLDDRFHRTGWWARMEQLQVTWINAVPAILSYLAHPGPDESVPSAIRFARSASAPLPTETLARFEAGVGIPVLETYGMTEACSQIAANPLDGRRKPGSVGRPFGVQLRIAPEEAQDDVGPRVGEVEIRGPSVITCYADVGYEHRFTDDGWLRTGDLGYLDTDGYLFLVGRVDDVINRSGEKIFPREIEELMLSDPDVADAAVVGADDPVLGQVPVGYLVLRPGDRGAADETASEVVNRVRLAVDSALPRTKRPTALHVVASLPVGPTGKLQRHAIGAHPLDAASANSR
jgi:acyl-CoA synthetase (AMP-forming)/AMP-acid ligase II